MNELPELPPLPEKAGWTIDQREDGWHVTGVAALSDGCDVYTAEQMQAYARAAVLAERERVCELIEQAMNFGEKTVNWPSEAEAVRESLEALRESVRA